MKKEKQEYARIKIIHSALFSDLVLIFVTFDRFSKVKIHELKCYKKTTKLFTPEMPSFFQTNSILYCLLQKAQKVVPSSGIGSKLGS